MAVELRDLRYFLVVAEELQVTRAAARLHVSQPTLSQAIDRLERQVGAPLFTRHAAGVRLTAAGQVLVTKATAALAAVDEAIAAVAEAPPESLTIGFVPPVHDAAGAAAAALRSSHVDVDLRWVALDYAGTLHALRRAAIDVAFVWARSADPALSFASVIAERQTVLVARDHPLAARPAVSFDDLRHITERSSRQLLLDPCALTEPRAPQERARPLPPTMDEIWALVASHEAVALVPASVGRRSARAGVVMRPVFDRPDAVLAVAWRTADTRREVTTVVTLASSMRTPE
jgi:DNA-binding transcriptional LysR family regulator